MNKNKNYNNNKKKQKKNICIPILLFGVLNSVVFSPKQLMRYSMRYTTNTVDLNIEQTDADVLRHSICIYYIPIEYHSGKRMPQISTEERNKCSKILI